MAIAREELYEGGQAFLRTRFNNGHGMRSKPVIVLDVLRGAAKVRTADDGREIVVKFSELEPDHDWLEERDRREDEKLERVRREAEAPWLHAVAAEEPAPFKVSLGEVVMAKTAAKKPEMTDEELAKKALRDMGARLALIREARGLNQQQLTRRAGISEGSVNRYERGEYPPRPAQRALLATALEVPEDVLFNIEAPLPELAAFAGTPPQEKVTPPPAVDYIAMGKRITRIRQLRKLTVTAMCTRGGMGLGSGRRYEAGEIEVRPETVEKLARALEVSPEVLYGTLPMPEELTSKRPSSPPKAPEQQILHIPGKRPEPAVARSPSPPVLELVSRPKASATIPPPPPVPKAPKANGHSATPDMLREWLAMGARLVLPLRAESEELATEIEALETRLTEARARRVDLAQQLAEVETMLGRGAG